MTASLQPGLPWRKPGRAHSRRCFWVGKSHCTYFSCVGHSHCWEVTAPWRHLHPLWHHCQCLYQSEMPPDLKSLASVVAQDIPLPPSTGARIPSVKLSSGLQLQKQSLGHAVYSHKRCCWKNKTNYTLGQMLVWDVWCSPMSSVSFIFCVLGEQICI